MQDFLQNRICINYDSFIKQSNPKLHLVGLFSSGLIKTTPDLNLLLSSGYSFFYQFCSMKNYNP